MPRTISDATTRLPDPVKLSDDLIRYYQLHPMRGQQVLPLLTGWTDSAPYYHPGTVNASRHATT